MRVQSEEKGTENDTYGITGWLSFWFVLVPQEVFNRVIEVHGGRGTLNRPFSHDSTVRLSRRVEDHDFGVRVGVAHTLSEDQIVGLGVGSTSKTPFVSYRRSGKQKEVPFCSVLTFHESRL